MIQKVKELFAFFMRAWGAGRRGKIGILMLLFAILFFVRMFMGHATVQGLVRDYWGLERARAQLVAEQKTLYSIEKQIRLIQIHSPDFITELSQQHLNMGDPRTRILR